MIGDTPDVDILGACEAGIDQVYVNHTGKQRAGESNLYGLFSEGVEEIF